LLIAVFDARLMRLIKPVIHSKGTQRIHAKHREKCKKKTGNITKGNKRKYRKYRKYRMLKNR